MVFNSVVFWLFLPIVFALYASTPQRFRWVILLVASYVFYMWWNAFYVLIILASTVIDYLIGPSIADATIPKRKKSLLLTSLGLNLGSLFVFKYWSFFHESVAAVAALAGVSYTVPHLAVLLPVGISFYTFQTLSYTIDIYRGTLEPERHFGRFAVFVSFFPQLVAGPIERAADLLPQLRKPFELRVDAIQSGLQLAMWGLFKKVAIADWCALYVDTIYNNADHHSGRSLALATYAFAIQIYCDFSGYTDIAIGVARMFNIDLTENFRRPYFSKSLKELWTRWHISLSRWLRDYLYIPLGGNRHGQAETMRNMFLTMLIGGLWHGASWNFVLWGALHGLFLGVSGLTLPYRDAWLARLRVPTWLSTPWRMFVCFHLVCLLWIPFRANTLEDTLSIVTGIFTRSGGLFMDPLAMTHMAIGVTILVVVDATLELRPRGVVALWQRFPQTMRTVAAAVLLCVIAAVGATSDALFIYFQF